MLIHDVDRFNFGDEVDHYFKLAMDGAYKAVQKLKEEKVIKAIGVGVNDLIYVQDLLMLVILIAWF